jgi:hypothetical protein
MSSKEAQEIQDSEVATEVAGSFLTRNSAGKISLAVPQTKIKSGVKKDSRSTRLA